MLRLAAIVTGILLSACATPHRDDSQTTLYAGAQVWTGNNFEPLDFAVRDGVFVDPNTIPRASVRVDLSGAWVTPPFGDGHTHQFEGAWSFQRFNNQFLEQGVFYAQNPAGHASLMAEAREAAVSPDTVDVSFAMGGITTPYGHPEEGFVHFMTQFVYRGMTREDLRGQAVHPVTTQSEARAAIDRLINQGADFVKVFIEWSEQYEHRSRLLADDNYRSRPDFPNEESTSGVDPALVSYIVDVAHERGLRVAAHVMTVQDFRVALDANVDTIVHIPGALFYANTSADTYRITRTDAARAAAAGVSVVATASARLDAIPEEDREWFFELQAQNVRQLLDAGVPVLIGADNWSLTTLDEINHLRTIGAMNDAELLQAWIATGRHIFPHRQIGRIHAGYEASFLVLDGNPLEEPSALTQIRMRIKQGLPLQDSTNDDVMLH